MDIFFHEEKNDEITTWDQNERKRLPTLNYLLDEILYSYGFSYVHLRWWLLYSILKGRSPWSQLGLCSRCRGILCKGQIFGRWWCWTLGRRWRALLAHHALHQQYAQRSQIDWTRAESFGSGSGNLFHEFLAAQRYFYQSVSLLVMLQRPVNMQVGSHFFPSGATGSEANAGTVLVAFCRHLSLNQLPPMQKLWNQLVRPACSQDMISFQFFISQWVFASTSPCSHPAWWNYMAQKPMKVGKETTALEKGTFLGSCEGKASLQPCFRQRLNSNMIQRISRSKIYVIYRVVQEVVCWFSVQNRRSMRNIGKAWVGDCSWQSVGLRTLVILITFGQIFGREMTRLVSLSGPSSWTHRSKCTTSYEASPLHVLFSNTKTKEGSMQQPWIVISFRIL